MFSYKQALNYVNSLINYEKRPDFAYNQRLFNLERMRAILNKVGNPHSQLKTIHVAGTKGKGSTAAIIASILNAAGYKTGLYTSPHLISPRERIKINGSVISKKDFSGYLFQIKSAIEKIQQEGKSLTLTFFEAYTTLAFLYFYQKKVDIAVIEVGLGGRLDATNVIRPLVGIITPISIDHTRQLGNDIISIAKEKAGIIKPSSRIVISKQKKQVLQLLQKVCRQRGAVFYQVGKDITFNLLRATPEYQRFQVKGLLQKYPDLLIPLAGEHQLWNAATGIGAVELVQDSGLWVSAQNIKEGLRKVKWSGRLQIIAKNPLLLVDCAHNASSAGFLASFIRHFYSDKNIVLVLAVLKNKDVEGMAKALFSLADHMVITRTKTPRALPVEDLYAKIRGYTPVEPVTEQTVDKALCRAKKLAGKDGLICATGSVYLVGEILDLKKTRNILKEE